MASGLAFFAFDLRQLDSQDTIFDLCANLRLIHIVRQRVLLFKVRVSKLASQIVGMFVFFLVLELVLDGDAQVVVFIDVNSAVLFLNTRSSQLNFIAVLVLFDVCLDYRVNFAETE